MVIRFFEVCEPRRRMHMLDLSVFFTMFILAIFLIRREQPGRLLHQIYFGDSP